MADRLGASVAWFFEGLEAGPARLAEPAADFSPAPTPYDQTRALITLFKALPDDSARADVLDYIRSLSGR